MFFSAIFSVFLKYLQFIIVSRFSFTRLPLIWSHFFEQNLCFEKWAEWRITIPYLNSIVLFEVSIQGYYCDYSKVIVIILYSHKPKVILFRTLIVLKKPLIAFWKGSSVRLYRYGDDYIKNYSLKAQPALVDLAGKKYKYIFTVTKFIRP